MAQLMLHRDVLKIFGKLPAKVQKKVYELTRKFEEDSTQASIHLEHLSPMTRDPKIRSARVGDDYRAIVIAPDLGDVFLLVYIDHHDEAYAWCKNKSFEAHIATGTLQIFDIEETSAIAGELRTSPQYQEHYALDKVSDEELFLAGVPDALIPAVRAARSDDAFVQLADYLPKEAAQVLIGIISGMSLNDALNEMLGVEGDSDKPQSAGDFSHLTTAANIDLVLIEGEEHLREILSEDIEEWRIFLHPYQRKLVEWQTKGPMKINGAAGTGKTVALMHRAAYLAKDLTGTQEKVLVTTFTTNLSVTIKSLLEKLAPEAIANVEVTNLHTLARTICQRIHWNGKIAEQADIETIWNTVLASKVPDGFSREFITSEYSDVIAPMGIDTEEDYLTAVRSKRPRISRKQRKELWRVFIRFNQELRKRNMLTFDGIIHQARLAVEQGKFDCFRHVLVDELQDFGLEALKLIAAVSPIKEEFSDPLCVVGDGHQRVYNKTPVALSRAGINVRGRSRRLKINYRTTEEIRQYAHNLLTGLEVDDLDGGIVNTQADQSIMKGATPVIQPCSSDEEAAAAIVAWAKGLLNAGLGTHEICFTPHNKAVVTDLEAANIRTHELKAREIDTGQEEPGIRYGTRQRIKGLEFKAVALILTQNDVESIERFTNYVAATRAREHLLVIDLRNSQT
ncbi:UvrD-helicase domain-containing protein [uncultured Photobacterium sp.]|uniref:UvrD-helicase domain-containing protein n=1 Tax=uncultured Photobacterium sp. TaxID=173973 RepID=UPI002607525E|nr:UvrD-helicase domain-containing protein [uncultured Photobacterium sp.]